MKFLKSLLRFLLRVISILIVAAVAYGLFLLLAEFSGTVKSINENIIAAFVAALTAVFGYWYTQRQTKIRMVCQELWAFSGVGNPSGMGMGWNLMLRVTA